MRAVLGLLVTALVVAGLSAHPVQTFPTGTAMLAGTVVSDEGPTVVVRRAVVTLTDANGLVVRSTATDEKGRFDLSQVPAGRFMLSAAKGGYVKSVYGASRPGGPGVPLTVSAGRRSTGLNITLLRGAVITGSVRDQRGMPLRGATVYVSRPGAWISPNTGPSMPDAATSSITDDRGVYRAYGLRPGEYLVWTPGPSYADAGVTRLTTAEDLLRARQAMQAGRATAAGLASNSGTRAQAAGRAARFVDSYYPATVSSADATPVRVRAGEERAGIDLTRLLVPTARVSGAVRDDPGVRAGRLRVWIRTSRPSENRMQQNITVSPDGTFVAPHVPPGEYIVGASTEAVRALTGRWDGGASARTTVSINGTDRSDLVLTLQPGPRVSGRVAMDESAAPALAGIRVMLIEAGEFLINTVPDIITDADGTFVMTGVTPVAYNVRVTPPAGWRVKSITVPGDAVDRADVPLPVSAGGDVAMTIMLTRGKTQLGGVLQDASGRPTAGLTVMAFSADARMWGPQSRRVQIARPGEDGVFVFELPPGEYLLAALTDIDDEQRADPVFLASVATGAVRVTVADGQETVQHLRVVN